MYGCERKNHALFPKQKRECPRIKNSSVISMSLFSVTKAEMAPLFKVNARLRACGGRTKKQKAGPFGAAASKSA